MIALFRPERRDRIADIAFKVGDTLEGWLLGQAAAMTVIGVLTFVGLSVLGIPLSLALALIAAFLTFIPNIGPSIAALPASGPRDGGPPGKHDR